jgi:8-oxo-dGTP pyrophosphatase MutT (NUDIX family)
MREIKIALALITRGDNYFLQLRGDNPRIGGARLIGCFGGKIEEGETPLQAVSREVSEETTIAPNIERFTHIGSVAVTSDHDLEQVKIEAEVFKLVLEPSETFEATEGKVVVMTHREASVSTDKMTTGTRACFDHLVDRSG